MEGIGAGADTPAERPLPLTVAFLSSGDPIDPVSFSGTPFHMVEALRAIYPGLEVIRHVRPPWLDWIQAKVHRVTGWRANLHYSPRLNRRIARRIAARWRGRRVVAVVVVNAPLAAELAPLVPVINVSDATFVLMRNFYRAFDELDPKTAIVAERYERESIVRAAHNSFSSGWAARSAIADYGGRPEDVSAISWGCNIKDVHAEDVGTVDPATDACRLLFIGGDWERKGGDVVVAAAGMLKDRGLDVRVDLVGARPPELLRNLDWVVDHGFLSKADRDQYERLRDLIRRSAFLFLPTRQDCTPMVFAEANAYGTPGVTRDVGGVADVVENGVNGRVLPEPASPADFADAIHDLWTDPTTYRALRESSRRTYVERLNWSAWAAGIARAIGRLEEEGRI